MDKPDSEKRIVKLMEKAQEEKMSRHVHERRAKLGQITSITKLMEQLMEDDANVDVVKDKLLTDFSNLQKEFCEINCILKQLMTEEQCADDQTNWFIPKTNAMDDFFWKVEGWMHDVLKRSKQAERCNAQVKPEDVSMTKTTTKRSSRQSSQRGSVTSVASSAKVKTEMKKAALKVRAAALIEKLAIEREEAEWQAEQIKTESAIQAERMKREADIKAKKQMHELQTAIAEIDAKIEVLQKYESSQTDKNVTEVSDVRIASPVSGHHINVEDALQSQLPQRTSPISNVESNAGPVLDSLCKTITQQANLTEYLVKNHKASLLPDITIPTFSGDPLEYKNFIRAFEHAVEDRTDNNQDRLYFLQQYTSGQPRELVGSCLHMEPSVGYVKAKQMLKEYYGDDHKITEAYINKDLGWDRLQPEDDELLQSFGLFLTDCCNTMTDICYMEDLDNTANIREHSLSP